jgi:hypothetical protein
MISLPEIVTRIRESCPIFERRVGGTAGMATAMENSGADTDMPYGYVLSLYGQDVSDQGLAVEEPQTLRQYFAVIVVLDNRDDGGGSGAEGRGDLRELAQLNEVQRQLAAAFLGWRPVPRYGPVRYNRDSHIQMNNLCLWHQFEFYLEYLFDPITDPDEQDAVDAIINDIDSDPGPWEGSIGDTVREIHAREHLLDGLIKNPPDHDSWDDFFGHEFCPSHLSDSQVNALLTAYYEIIHVNPPSSQLSPQQIRDGLRPGFDYVEPPIPIVPPFVHGTPISEPPPNA